MINWHLEKKKVSELKNWKKNPRTITPEALEELEKSVNALGNFEPLVINTNGTVIAGNQRLRLETKKGNNEVDVYVPERELTEEEIKKIGVISNRHSGDWDMDILANEFEDILKELNFDDLLPDLVMEVNEDDYEEPEQLPSKVQIGDVWQLGKHRLMCGDSTKIEDVEKLMDGQKADMVFTDPPYNADYEGRGRNNLGKIKNDALTDDNFEKFIKDFVPLLVAFTKDGGAFYVCCNWKDSYPRFYFNLQQNGINISANIVWNKGSGGMGWQDYRYQYEFIIYGFKVGASHSWYGGRTETDIWDFNRDGRQVYKHPTQKPVQLSAKAIGNSSKSEDIVLDLFGGSGSTLIACEQTDRVCYMMELDTHYSSVIIDRWETLTGKKAVKI